MFSEHDAQKFRSVPKIARNVSNSMDIIFAYTVFHVSSDLQFKSELSKKIHLNELNIIVIENTFIIMPKWYM